MWVYLWPYIYEILCMLVVSSTVNRMSSHNFIVSCTFFIHMKVNINMVCIWDIDKSYGFIISCMVFIHTRIENYYYIVKCGFTFGIWVNRGDFIVYAFVWCIWNIGKKEWLLYIIFICCYMVNDLNSFELE